MEEKLRLSQPVIAGLKIVIAIAAIEFIVMLALHLLGANTSLPPYVLALIDTLILSIAAAIIIVYWVVNPMKLQQKLLQNEKTLRESENRYRSLFENMLEGYAYCKILLDHDKPEDFIYIDVNPAFEKLTGLKNAVGKKVSEVIPGIKESNPELLEIYGRVALTGKPERFETYLESLGFWFSVSVYSPGKEYFVAVFDNITERKRAEQEIESVSRFPAENPNPILRVELDGRIIYANQASEALLRLWNCTVGEYLPTEWRERVVKAARDSAGTTVEAECEERICSIMIVPIPDPGYVNLYGLDITELRHAEETMRKSEQQFRSIWEHSVDGMRLTNEAGQIIEVNESYCRLVNMTRDNLVGQLLSVVYERRGPDDTLDIYSERFRSGKVDPHITVPAILWDGRSVELEISSSYIGDKGHNKKCLSIFRDITERKKTEKVNGALSLLGYRLSSAESSEQAARIIADVADQLFGWDACVVDYYSAQQDSIIPILNCDTLNGKKIEVASTHLSEKPTERLRQTLKMGSQLILREEGYGFASEAVPFGDISRPSASLMYVPIHHGAENIGIFSIQSYTLNKYNENDLATLQGLADHCGGAFARIRAQDELKVQTSNFRQLFENSPYGIALLDENDNVVDINRSFTDLFHFQLNDIKGRNLNDFIVPDDLLGEAREYRVKRSKGEIVLVETVRKRSDGSLVHVLITAKPVNVAQKHAGVFISYLDITERKLAEEQNRILAQAIKSISECVSITDLDNKILFLNDVFLRTYGYEEGELLGKDIGLVRSVENRDGIGGDILASTIQGSWQGELLNRRKDNSEFSVSLSTSIVTNEEGKAIALIGVATDITERKQAEKIIQKNYDTQTALNDLLHISLDNTSLEDILKRAFDLVLSIPWLALEAKGGIFLVEDEPDVLVMKVHNNLAESLIRMCARVPFGKCLCGRAAATQQIQFCNHLDERHEIRYEGMQPHGHFCVPILSAGRTIGVMVLYIKEEHNQDQNEEEFLSVFTNALAGIIERKHAEEAVVASEIRYRRLFEAAKDGILILDAETGMVVDVNPFMIEMLGYSHEQFIGKTIWELGFFKDIIANRDKFLELQQKGFIRYEDLPLETSDGRRMAVEFVSNSYEINHQKVIQCNIHDITRRKNAEETRKSLEAQLHQVQKLESIGTLASGIAHDFNNILGIILGYSSLLGILKEDPQKYSEAVVAIEKATRRGAGLVKQLLTFARKTEAHFESVSINDMIVEITKLLEETFPKTITVSTTLQQDLPAIVADASQIHQVLLNLCVNARDAMPKRGTLSISTRTIDGEVVSTRFSKKATARQYVQIEVADTGIGMDESTRQKIFEPFFTTKDPGKGTGLGLSVVFGIVESHSGIIDVRSAPGEGTSFIVYLPMPEREVEVLQPAGKDLKEISGGTETILIIEDEELLKELLKASLVSKGYTILTAGDGVQGVKMYQSHQKEIAVVVSDVGLPLLNGQDVFREIRKINPEAKVILASGFIEPEAKSQMYRAGLKNFIQKPYLQDEVLQKIREAIDRK
jgi:PAS domain S-box-containing protein